MVQADVCLGGGSAGRSNVDRGVIGSGRAVDDDRIDIIVGEETGGGTHVHLFIFADVLVDHDRARGAVAYLGHLDHSIHGVDIPKVRDVIQLHFLNRIDG